MNVDTVWTKVSGRSKQVAADQGWPQTRGGRKRVLTVDKNLALLIPVHT